MFSNDGKLPGKLDVVAVSRTALRPPHKTSSSYPVGTNHEPPCRLWRSIGLAFPREICSRRRRCFRLLVEPCLRTAEFSTDSLNKFGRCGAPHHQHDVTLHSRQNIAFNLTLTPGWNTSIGHNCLSPELYSSTVSGRMNRLECWTQSCQYHALFCQSITLGRHTSRLWPAGQT